MTVLAFKVFYDGILFSGFTNGPGSIEYYLRRAINHFVKTYSLSKASRTDPGVSAIGNVISIRCIDKCDLNPGMINSRLPNGLRVWAWAHANEDFRARSAKSRTYVYIMPWLYEDVDLMNKVASLFIGTHDLVNFQVKERGVPTVVTIYEIKIYRDGPYIVFIINGKGFRNKMIRKIVNSIRMVGLGTLSPEELEELISSKVKRPVPPAPPYGLLLLSVNYGDKEPNWHVHWDGVSYVINYLNGRLYNSLSSSYIILKILHEFMDINKLFSHI
ncbi:MAG: tRNA pseudouridine synthase A [Vulcanisaeta sp.]